MMPWRLALRELTRRPGRAALTFLGISIGVSSIVSVPLTIHNTRAGFRKMFETVASRASLEVVSEGLGAFGEDAGAPLVSTPGVKAVVPVIQSPVALLGPSGASPALLLGIDPRRDAAARDLPLREGKPLDPSGDAALLEAGFAAANGLRLGALASIWTPTGTARLPVVGLLEPRGPAAASGGAILFVPLAVAQKLFGLEGKVNCLQVVLEEGARPEDAGREISRRLPAGLSLRTPAARGELGRLSVLSTEQALSALSAVSLVGAGFVILNTFLMSLSERRRQLALVRALGATRGQLTRWLLRESLLLGAAGTALGIPAGAAMASVLARALGHEFGLSVQDLEWPPAPFLLAVCLGPGLPVAATFLPAWWVAREPVLDDLLYRRRPSRAAPRRWPATLGCVLVAPVIALETALLLGWIPAHAVAAFLGPGMALGLIGLVLMVPLVLPALLETAAKVLRPLGGVEAALSLRQLRRHPTRTSLTVAVLFIALVVANAMGLSLLIQTDKVREYVARISDVDYFIRGVWPAPTLLFTAPIPESMAAELGAMEGVRYVDKLSWIPARTGSQQVMVLAVTFGRDRPLFLDLERGRPEEAREGLLRGEVVVGSTLAQRLGVGLGDEIPIETRLGPRPLRIAGTATEYTAAGMALYMDWSLAKEVFDAPGAHLFRVASRPGEERRLAAQLQSYCEERSLLLQSAAEFRAVLLGMVDDVCRLVWALIVLSFVVASLGVVNTLTMNVLEQTREIGLLRAVGMRRGGVLKLVSCQALLIGGASLPLGAVVGLALAYGVHAAGQAVGGIHAEFHVDSAFFGSTLALTLATALGAALLPARRAARIEVMKALHLD